MNYLAWMALAVGMMVGSLFGWLQWMALRRAELRQREQKAPTFLDHVLHSVGRVIFLFVALALVQVVFPWLFPDANKWWVTAGVVLGYGFVLFLQLREKISRK